MNQMPNIGTMKHSKMRVGTRVQGKFEDPENKNKALWYCSRFDAPRRAAHIYIVCAAPRPCIFIIVYDVNKILHSYIHKHIEFREEYFFFCNVCILRVHLDHACSLRFSCINLYAASHGATPQKQPTDEAKALLPCTQGVKRRDAAQFRSWLRFFFFI